MFLEGERALLLRRLMSMRESRGDLEGAASASREIQVEVCNSLSSREKAEFLLEQVCFIFYVLCECYNNHF